MKTSPFKLNSPTVIYDQIDGEVIIVNRKSGHYYSLTKSGATLFTELINGADSRTLETIVSGHFSESKSEWEKSIQSFVDELTKENIIIPEDQSEPQKSANKNFAKLLESLDKNEPPKIEKYTDVEELLALDPVHEVDQSGWPNKGNS